jgi:DNA-binding LytR/AlgR family response regulator
MNGVEAAIELRAQMPKLPIVLFTMYDDVVGRAPALSARCEYRSLQTTGRVEAN